jgi:SnoaL-like domain
MGDVQAIADRFEIEALRGEFTDAVMMRDYDRLASLFTPDGAVRIPNINAKAVSREEIRAGIERLQGLLRQLSTDHIREIHARAEDERRARQARRPRRRAPSIRLSGAVAGVLGVAHAFGELRPALVRRGDALHENGGALGDVRAGPHGVPTSAHAA